MSTAGLSKALEHFRLELLPDARETDGQLLTRFVAGRDEIAFAALVRRYEPLVFGVCRRVLRNHHDAEDAFQATFLVLARKAGNVAKRETLGCWLSRVAYHVALEVRTVNTRRQAQETSLADVPPPEIPPPEPNDWRPLLDEELNRLPEKYRSAIVLCELEGRPRREAAGLLGLPEGTLSSRLAMARKMLGERLTRRGLTLTGTALTTAFAPGPSPAGSTALLATTVRAALLVAAGQSASVTTPAAILMNGVLKTMFLQKLKVVTVAVLVTATLGAGGFFYLASSVPGKAQAQVAPAKPQNELEALRKENELLKLNLQVVLEKVRSQEEQLRALKAEKAVSATAPKTAEFLPRVLRDHDKDGFADYLVIDPFSQADAALKAWRNAKDQEAKKRAAEALEKATKKLREQLKDPATKPERR